MIKINIPNNNLSERIYIINTIFRQFLGLNYKISITFCNNYEITFANNNTLVIEDHFFNLFPCNLDYLKKESVPKAVLFTSNTFILEDDIPIIFGTPDIEIFDKSIRCGIDIFSSCFYMLTRWEEYVNQNRDIHQRFPANQSLSHRFGFLNRPVVNEYVEMLWNMMLFCGVNQDRRKKSFELILTHDVDIIIKNSSLLSLLRTVSADILIRKNLICAFKSTTNFILTKLKYTSDHYDTFDYIIKMSNFYGFKSIFFMMASGETNYDNFYSLEDSYTKEIIRKIKGSKHIIGIHPTYNAFISDDRLAIEKNELETAVGESICCGRDHYLRFEVPTTWQVLDNNNLSWDSTMGYAESTGFRCGTTCEFFVYDILKRKQLNLKEKPLLMMDKTLISYLNLDKFAMKNLVDEYIDITKKYDIPFVVLWHNSSFDFKCKRYYGIYEYILKRCFKE